MNWHLPPFSLRVWSGPSLGLARAFAMALVCFAMAGGVQATQPEQLYQQDLSGRLQQQIQNDPVLNPQPQPVLKAPEAKAEPAPQPEDESAVKITVNEFVVIGNELIATANIQELLKPWLNTPISLNELRRAVAQVAALYRAQGYLAQAVLPNQDVTEGTVKVQVVEGKVGKIIIDAPQGQRQIGSVAISRIQTLLASTLATNGPLHFDSFDWAALVASELPGISTKVSLQAGREPGTTDVLASLQATELVQGAATFDNQGSRNTGEERLNAQFQVNSYFGGGEQFAVAVSKTQGSEFMRLGVKFPIALPSWRGLSVELSQSRLNYKVLRSMWGEDAEVAPQGFSNTGGIGFSYPLIRSSSGNITLTLEREHRDSEDKSDEYSVDRGDLTAFRATDAQVDQFAIASNFSDLWMGGGNNVVNLTIYNGRVDLLAHTAILDQSLQEDLEGLNTSGAFKKQRLTVSRLQYLSARNSLFMTATSQWANKNLDSSEKFYLGGPNGVRAYPASEIGGSEGLLTSIEWRHALTERWQLGLFYDYGRVRQLVRTLSPTGDALISDGDTNIHKIKGRGLSAAYTHPNGMQFKATVSRRIGDNPAPTEEGTDKDGTLRMNRWWLSASIPF